MSLESTVERQVITAADAAHQRGVSYFAVCGMKDDPDTQQRIVALVQWLVRSERLRIYDVESLDWKIDVTDSGSVTVRCSRP